MDVRALASALLAVTLLPGCADTGQRNAEALAGSIMAGPGVDSVRAYDADYDNRQARHPRWRVEVDVNQPEGAFAAIDAARGREGIDGLDIWMEDPQHGGVAFHCDLAAVDRCPDAGRRWASATELPPGHGSHASARVEVGPEAQFAVGRASSMDGTDSPDYVRQLWALVGELVPPEGQGHLELSGYAPIFLPVAAGSTMPDEFPAAMAALRAAADGLERDGAGRLAVGNPPDSGQAAPSEADVNIRVDLADSKPELPAESKRLLEEAAAAMRSAGFAGCEVIVSA